MFEQASKSIDDTLRTEQGMASELDYSEQTSWVLFFQYAGPSCRKPALGS